MLCVQLCDLLKCVKNVLFSSEMKNSVKCKSLSLVFQWCFFTLVVSTVIEHWFALLYIDSMLTKRRNSGHSRPTSSVLTLHKAHSMHRGRKRGKELTGHRFIHFQSMTRCFTTFVVHFGSQDHRSKDGVWLSVQHLEICIDVAHQLNISAINSQFVYHRSFHCFFCLCVTISPIVENLKMIKFVYFKLVIEVCLCQQVCRVTSQNANTGRMV